MSIFSFDASAVPAQAPSTPIPAGTYLAHIMESDCVTPKSGRGLMIKLTFEILDGQFKGRRVWENLNVQNDSEKTQSIAQSQLSAICHAVGVIKLNDTAALHFKPLKINVVIKEASGDYAARNNIKGYESAAGAMPASAPTPPAANAPSGAPAWARKAA